MVKASKTVYVGLSGGVDSSVVATLLVRQGYHVVGAYMKNWTRDIAGNQCPWEDDLRSAKSVSAHLGIELVVFDLQEEYRERVVDTMVEAYKSGLTPNPDVLCNEEIKFSLFYDLCRKAGADYVATGHYARLVDGKLFRAKDNKKDQTYFLYRMPQSVASYVLFPLGEYQKSQVRELASEFGLATANRRESMGLCFVGKIPLKDFLGEFIELEAGNIISHETQQIIGQHHGAMLYTIGQRHGLGVGGGQPYYVLSKDLKKNEVVVTVDPSTLRRSHYDIDDVVWWQEPKKDCIYKVRIRHLGELLDCHLVEQGNNRWRVMLTHGEHRGVAMGQHAVIYDGDMVLGGGFIQ